MSSNRTPEHRPTQSEASTRPMKAFTFQRATRKMSSATAAAA